MSSSRSASTVNEIMTFGPKMSYLPKEFMDRDPEFWNPKPAAPARKNEAKAVIGRE